MSLPLPVQVVGLLAHHAISYVEMPSILQVRYTIEAPGDYGAVALMPLTFGDHGDDAPRPTRLPERHRTALPF